MLLGLQLKVTEYVLDESDQLMPMNRLHGENTVTGKNVTFSVLWSGKTKIPLMLNKRKNVKRFRGILSLFVLFVFFFPSQDVRKIKSWPLLTISCLAFNSFKQIK